MKPFDLNTTEYTVSGLPGYSLTDALQHWKAKFETIKHFKRDVITHPGLKHLGDFVEEVWEQISPVSVQQALREKNVEKRRVMFDCIGVAKLFQTLCPELIDKQTISKVRTRWDSRNQPYESKYDDTYELYRISQEKLFEKNDGSPMSDDVFAVRCWCTSTKREYWIYVPESIAAGSRWRYTDGEEKPDAIRAIAWTIRIDISHPKRIHRQGDIIIVEESELSETKQPYHLSKEEYLNLMYSET